MTIADPIKELARDPQLLKFFRKIDEINSLAR
jgi:hypothetical protein